MTHFTALLDDRAVLAIGGTDARAFLQNLITNDMEHVRPGPKSLGPETLGPELPGPELSGPDLSGRGIYAFLLSAQGKYLHDFFILQANTAFLLITALARIDDLRKRLTMLKLRADVSINRQDGVQVYAKWPFENEAGNFSASPNVICDGRGTALPGLFLTAVPPAFPVNATSAHYYSLLADKGIATPHRDFIPEKTTLMEAGLDGQFAVSWTKGCFVGQELTARVKYRGLVKRLLIPTRDAHPAGTPVLHDGQTVGVMQSKRFVRIKREAIRFSQPPSLKTGNGDPLTLLQPDWWHRSAASHPPAETPAQTGGH